MSWTHAISPFKSFSEEHPLPQNAHSKVFFWILATWSFIWKLREKFHLHTSHWNGFFFSWKDLICFYPKCFLRTYIFTSFVYSMLFSFMNSSKMIPHVRFNSKTFLTKFTFEWLFFFHELKNHAYLSSFLKHIWSYTFHIRKVFFFVNKRQRQRKLSKTGWATPQNWLYKSLFWVKISKIFKKIRWSIAHPFLQASKALEDTCNFISLFWKVAQLKNSRPPFSWADVVWIFKSCF